MEPTAYRPLTSPVMRQGTRSRSRDLLQRPADLHGMNEETPNARRSHARGLWVLASIVSYLSNLSTEALLVRNPCSDVLGQLCVKWKHAP